MRISSNSDDPGFSRFQEALIAGQVPVVFLDDNEVMYCFMADEEAGQVRRYLRNASGFVVDGDEVAAETLTGRVRVEFR